MLTTSFYSDSELKNLGLKKYGRGVLISRKVSIYSACNIEIGDNVRIDDFTILSGKIVIGSHIHISAYCALYGAKGIYLEDYTGISPRTSLFSAMDDFSGDYLIGPIHPVEKTNVQGGPIILKKYSQIGAGCVVFPNTIIGEGSVVGAMSLVNQSVSEWTIYAGIPAKKIKDRRKNLLKLL